MKLNILLIAITINIVACNNKNDSSLRTTSDSLNAKKDSVQYGKMKGYWMVFLYSGPNRNQDSIAAAKIQKAHMTNIERLAKEGKLIMAGPMGDETNLRGIFILNCKDSTEADNYVRSDTAVKTGRLRFEIHPWWTATGTYVFK